MKRNFFVIMIVPILAIFGCANNSDDDTKQDEFETVKNQISEEQNALDSTFQRDGYKVTYLMSYDPNDSMPSVFKRSANGDITINKGYINNASEAEKAVLAYYSKLYNSGCIGGTCELSNALELGAQNSAAQNDLIKKWFKSGKPLVAVKSASGTIADDSTWNKFTEIRISKRPYEIHTAYSYIDGQNQQTNVNEVYKILNDLELTLVSGK